MRCISDHDDDARLSPCGAYRWWLTRRWSDAPSLTAILLNPSTADARHDDPTVRRLSTAALRCGAGGLVLVNLFALRSRDPADLMRAEDPVGAENDHAIGSALMAARAEDRPVFAGWGDGGPAKALVAARAPDVLRMVAAHRLEIVTLGATKHGQPRHPLYAPRLRWEALSHSVARHRDGWWGK